MRIEWSDQLSEIVKYSWWSPRNKGGFYQTISDNLRWKWRWLSGRYIEGLYAKEPSSRSCWNHGFECVQSIRMCFGVLKCLQSVEVCHERSYLLSLKLILRILILFSKFLQTYLFIGLEKLGALGVISEQTWRRRRGWIVNWRPLSGISANNASKAECCAQHGIAPLIPRDHVSQTIQAKTWSYLLDSGKPWVHRQWRELKKPPILNF